MTTLKHSQGTLYDEEELTALNCFPAASPARIYAVQAAEPGLTAQEADFGLSRFALSRKPSPDLSSLRTSLICGLLGLTSYSLAWKDLGTPQNRSWWVLGRLARPRTVRGFGSWPTLAASQMQKPIRPLIPSEKSGKHGIMTVGAIGLHFPELIGQKVNPEWAEAMMGLPPGWTECDGPPLLGIALNRDSLPSPPVRDIITTSA